MKYNKRGIKKYMNKKAGISYLQILTLILSIFAFSYLIYDSTKPVSAIAYEDIVTGGAVRGGSASTLNFIAGYSCCSETTSGNTCQYVPDANCTAGASRSPNPCEGTVFCQSGCCFSRNTGLCGTSPKITCESGGGIWTSGSCAILSCVRACCVLGTQAKFTTQRNCEIESGFLGIPVDFRTDIRSESECIFLTQRDDEGACVFESGEETTCLFMTREECISRTRNENNFYKDTFCSSPELNTGCAAHNYDGCVDGKEEVYWYDSCGNREDVKQNCSLFLGSICGRYRDGLDTRPSEGEYTCRSLDCRADNGMNYKNGESWCEYEGTVGDGRDVAGSRHVLHKCYMGQERIEPCADYRNQICVGEEVNLGNGQTFSEAVCRQNNWQNCLSKNMIRGEASTGDNPDCIIKSIDLTEGDEGNFNFDMIVPKYPPGFDLENNLESAQAICSFGTQTCTYMTVQELDGEDCIYNCGCEDKGEFTRQMNELCISLGDCGGYVNTEGRYTDSGYDSAVKINGDRYIQYSEPKRNLNMIEPGNTAGSLVKRIVNSGSGPEAGGMSTLSMMTLGVQGVQILGLANWFTENDITAGIGNWFSGEGTDLGTASIDKAANSLAGKDVAGNQIPPDAVQTDLASSQVGWSNIFSSLSAGLSVASILSLGFGIEEETALYIGLAVFGTLLLALNQGWIDKEVVDFLGIAGFIFMIYMWIAGIGEMEEKEITFTCLPWQAPTGGADCDKCNPVNEFDVPCTEYKCKSLGQGCELINAGTEDEKCINLCSGTGFSSPRISPGRNISAGHAYREVSDTGFAIKTSSGACIDEYTEVRYGITTNKPAQCKIGTSPLQSYDEMDGGFFGGKNTYTINHTATLIIPSINAFRNQYELTQAQIESLGDLKFYVKCKEACEGLVNEVPYTIRTCVNPGPDRTPPRIQKIEPASGAFVRYGDTTKNIMLWVNEPANCRWDTRDIDYNDMTNEMNCRTGINQRQIYGWACNTTLTGINNNTRFYFRCKDQPWLPDTNTSRNKMTQSEPYRLSVSSSPLSIIDFRPEDGHEFVEGVEPVALTLNVRTSGGAENGKAICEWEGNGYSDQFQETNSNTHTYNIDGVMGGDYNVNFYCEDAAGNNATAATSFAIKIDTRGPKIIRAYFDNALKIVTDEEAECRYGFDRLFRFENATRMTDDGIEHTANWELKTYYIQCEDRFNTKGGKTIIRAYEIA